MIRNYIRMLVVLTMASFVSNINAQQPWGITYSDSEDTNVYLLSAPDSSIELSIDPYGARAIEILVNGSWNRTENPISFSDRANQLKMFDFALGTYTDVTTNNNRPRYQISQTSSNSMVMTATATVNGAILAIKRTLTLSSNGQVSHAIAISNTSSQAVSLDFGGLAFSTSSLADISKTVELNNNIMEYQYFNSKKIQKAKISAGGFFGKGESTAFLRDAEWLTLADNFFLFTITPSETNVVSVYQGLEFGKKGRVNLGVQHLATNLQANQEFSMNLNYYVGPRSEKFATLANPSFQKLFAWPWLFHWMLKPIEHGTYWSMDKLNMLFGNPGITLMLIALIVKLLLLPLSIKSAVSMRKMREIQPKLNKLQEKWGHDPQLLQQKTMELYKQEKVNPLGGCLPLLFQIPVFFALFRVLSRSVDLRGASFLWINDLTLPDSLFMIGGFSFNLLPIIMTILQLISVVLQQKRAGTSNNEMQKQMQTQSYLMPVIFLFLFWNMPSGLVLYWTTQNIFSIIEQEAINLSSKK